MIHRHLSFPFAHAAPGNPGPSRRLGVRALATVALWPVTLMLSQSAAALVFQSESSGAWAADCTWHVCPVPGGSGFPGSGDTALVRHFVTFGAQQSVGTLVLTGTVQGGTLDIEMSGIWNSGTFESGVYNILKTLDITHIGPIGIQNLHGTLNNPLGSVITQNSTYQMHNAGTVNNDGLYGITNDSDIGNSVAVGPVINNRLTGVFSKTGGTGTSSVSGDIEFNNQGGTIAAQSGTLSISRLTGSGGTLNAANGAILEIAAGELAGAYGGSGAGTVRLGNGIFTGTATFNLPGSLLQWNGGTIQGAYANNMAMAITGAGRLQGTLTNNGVISQSANFTIIPGGTGTLSNIGTFNITTDADILNSIASGPIIINALGGTFAKTGGSGTSSVSGDIIFENQGGTIAAETGTLVIGKLRGVGGILNAAPGATLRLQGVEVTGVFTGSGGGTVELDLGFQGTATFAMPGSLLQWTGGNVTGALTNTGNLGIVTGAGRLTGGSIVNQGLIAQSATLSMTVDGTLLENRGTYNITNDSDIGNGVSGTPLFRNTASGSFAKTAGIATSSISGVEFDNQGLVAVHSGTLALANVTQHPIGSSTLTGGTWVVMAGATLNVSSGNNIVINQGNVSLSGVGSTFAKINALADNQGGFAILDGRNFTTTGNLQNSGTLTVGQGSILTIKPSSVLTSSGTIRGGGSIIGNVVSSGRAAPGTSIGTLVIDGDLTLASAAGSVLEIEIANTASFDVLAVSGLAGLGGTLKVELLPGYAPVVGDSFSVMRYASFSGSFDFYDLPALGGGLFLQPAVTAGGLTLTVAVPEPGTYGMMLLGLGSLGWRLRRAAPWLSATR